MRFDFRSSLMMTIAGMIATLAVSCSGSRSTPSTGSLEPSTTRSSQPKPQVSSSQPREPNAYGGLGSVLNDVDKTISDVQQQLPEIEAEGQQYQQYLKSLQNACSGGNDAACRELSTRMKVQNQHLDRLKQQTDPNSPRNRDWAKSFCQPYCNK